MWHRAVFVVVAATAGRWAALSLRVATARSVAVGELLLAVLEAAALLALAAALRGFARLRPWSIPLSLAVLAVCAVPVVQRSEVAGTTLLAGHTLTTRLAVARLQAPSLWVSLPIVIDVVPVALGVWLWVLRSTHRRVAVEAPLGAHELRPRRLALAAAVGAAILGAASVVSVAGGEARLDRADAETAVSNEALADGLERVACTASAGPFEATLVRPFYVVLFVGEGGALPGPGVGYATVAAASGQVRPARPAVDRFPDAPDSTAALCAGATLDVDVRTVTGLLPVNR